MCGIIGFVRTEDSFKGETPLLPHSGEAGSPSHPQPHALPHSPTHSASAASLVLEGLRRLEYRGYDSAGIASLHNGELLVRKDVGCIAEVDARQNFAGMPGDVAIGHTRWATNGDVSQSNAHPQTDAAGHVAVVHNGIIENYMALRAELESQGVPLVSQTDTEVIPNLLAAALRDGSASLEQAVRAVCARLEGCYAFAAVRAEEPDRIVAVRRGNPLVVGFGQEGAFLGSDPFAFGPGAQSMAAPEDGEMVVLARSGVRFLDGAGLEIQKERRPVEAGWGEADKNGCPYYMLKEIQEQPQALLHTLQQDDALLLEVAMEVLRARQVVFTACGTSRHAALIGRYLFSHVARKFSDVVMASEFGYFADSIDRHTLVIAVSQSGETADVLDGVRLAKQAGARIVGIVNRPSCLLAGEADYVIKLNCGPEVAVAATKSFLSQLSIFYQLAFAMTNRLEEGRRDLRQGAHELEELLRQLDHNLHLLAWELHQKEHAYYLGRGINFATAMEGALKMKEISYVHAEGMPAGELKHGTLALIEPGVPVVAICPGDETHEATVSNAAEAKARGARIIGISDVPSPVYDDWVQIPRVPPLLYPVMLIVPLQLLAYHVAVMRGCDPDKPRNLAKSVTVR